MKSLSVIYQPAIVVILALTLALKWSSDLENGRLELIFSTPQSRPRVLLDRFCANALVVLLAPVLTWLVLTIGARIANLDVNQGRLLAASFSILPPALITMGLIYALAGRLRYGAVLGIVTAYLVLSYLQESLEGSIQFPGWFMSLSIFHLYGNPIFQGMNWTNFLGMITVAHRAAGNRITLKLLGIPEAVTASLGLAAAEHALRSVQAPSPRTVLLLRVQPHGLCSCRASGIAPNCCNRLSTFIIRRLFLSLPSS